MDYYILIILSWIISILAILVCIFTLVGLWFMLNADLLKRLIDLMEARNQWRNKE